MKEKKNINGLYKEEYNILVTFKSILVTINLMVKSFSLCILYKNKKHHELQFI